MKQTWIALAGALVGGTLGHFAFFWIARQGYYGLILPGGLLGIGAGFGRIRSVWVAVGCSLAAIALGLFTEWRFAPFEKDQGLAFFLGHVLDLKPVTLGMIGVGGALGFWIPFRSIERPHRSGEKYPAP